MRKLWWLALAGCAGSGSPDGLGQSDADTDGVSVEETAVVATTGDTGGPDGTPVEPSDGAWDGCRSLIDACPGTEICDLALGRCELRSDWASPDLQLFSFHPPEAAEGDLLVIDGTDFWTSLFGARSVSVSIGGQDVALYPHSDPDDTRILVPVPAGASGEVAVTNNDGSTVTAALSLGAAASGVLPCDGTTPTGSGEPGATVDASGPYAAGYVDLPERRARVHYPAQCGSVRRPPVAGTWPLVGLMHGNGAGFMAMEYLGQLLATWGFVSVQAHSIHDDVAITPDQVQHLVETFTDLRGVELGGEHPALAGVTTTTEVGFVGHSRGTARIQNLLAAGLEADTVAVVFLGAVDDGLPVSGLYLQIDGTHDRQSPGIAANGAWNRAPSPKWRVTIDGGNHSLFTDHVVWTGFLDDEPTVARRDQHRTVTGFTLPLMQRAFGLDEPFASQLDSPPAIPGLTVEVVP